MLKYVESLIVEAVAIDNIMPLTSVCNVRYLFCSHRQNNPGVHVYSIATITLAQVEQVLEFIDPIS